MFWFQKLDSTKTKEWEQWKCRISAMQACRICALDCGKRGKAAIQGKIFIGYSIRASSRRTSVPWYRVCFDYGRHSHTEGDGRLIINLENQKRTKEIFQANLKRSLREAQGIVGFHSTIILHFEHSIEDALLPPPDWTTTVGNWQGTSCYFYSVMRRKIGRDFQLFATHGFLWQGQLIVRCSFKQVKL